MLRILVRARVGTLLRICRGVRLDRAALRSYKDGARTLPLAPKLDAFCSARVPRAASAWLGPFWVPNDCLSAAPRDRPSQKASREKFEWRQRHTKVSHADNREHCHLPGRSRMHRGYSIDNGWVTSTLGYLSLPEDRNLMNRRSWPGPMPSPGVCALAGANKGATYRRQLARPRPSRASAAPRQLCPAAFY